MISKSVKRTLIASVMIALALAGAFLFNAVASSTSSTSYASEAELSGSKDDVQEFMSKKRHTTFYLPNRNKNFGSLIEEWSVRKSVRNKVKNLKSSSSAVKARLGE